MENKEILETFIEEKFQRAVDQICEIVTEDERDNYQSQLEPFEAHKERQKHVLQKKFEELREEYATAYEVVFEHLIGGQSTKIALSRPEKEVILYEITKGQQNLVKIIESNQLEHLLSEGKTFQDILGYSVKTLEKFYFVGLECIEKQQFRKGKDVFILLTLINPGYHNFWVSLVLCLQALGEWHLALHACSIAEAIDATDPMPYLYASECYAELKDNVLAMEEVDKAILHVDQHEEVEFAEIKRMAIEWKEQLVKTA